MMNSARTKSALNDLESAALAEHNIANRYSDVLERKMAMSVG